MSAGVAALVSIAGLLLTFIVGIRQVRRSVNLTCWSNTGPRGGGLSSPLHPRGFSALPSPPRLPQPPRGRARKLLSDPGMPVATTTKEMASGDPIGPIWLRLRGERRVTLLDLALAGEAA